MSDLPPPSQHPPPPQYPPPDEPVPPAQDAKTAPIRLHPDEVVILDVLPAKIWTLGLYIFTLGLWAFWRQRHHYVLTNDRIVATKGIITKSEQSSPLARIQDAHLRRSIFTGGSIALSTAGGSLGVERIGPLTRADAVAFADAMTPLLGKSPAT